jgi:hypothetical protein
MCAIHFDYDAHDIRLELRRANVDYAAALLPIVCRTHAEHCAFEIDHHSVGRLERKIIDFNGRIDADHDLSAASSRYYAHRPYCRGVRGLIACNHSPRADCCGLKTSGSRYKRESGAGRQELPHCVLTLVESTTIASDSWRL